MINFQKASCNLQVNQIKVLKWVVNRPYQTKILESWAEMSGPSCKTTKN